MEDPNVIDLFKGLCQDVHYPIYNERRKIATQTLFPTLYEFAISGWNILNKNGEGCKKVLVSAADDFFKTSRIHCKVDWNTLYDKGKNVSLTDFNAVNALLKECIVETNDDELDKTTKIYYESLRTIIYKKNKLGPGDPTQYEVVISRFRAAEAAQKRKEDAQKRKEAWQRVEQQGEPEDVAEDEIKFTESEYKKSTLTSAQRRALEAEKRRRTYPTLASLLIWLMMKSPEILSKKVTELYETKRR